MENKSLFVKCDCNSEMIELQKFDYSDYDYEGNHDTGFYITLWKMGYNEEMSFWERVRWCWELLKTGKPFADMVIIRNDKAKEIVAYINKNTKENYGKKKTK